MTADEVIELLESIEPGITQHVEVSRKTTLVHTFDVVPVDEGNPSLGTTIEFHTDSNGEAKRIEHHAIVLKRGRVSCEIDLTVGEGSPHTRTPRTRDELSELVRVQLGNLLFESTRKPMSNDEWNAYLAAEMEKARVAEIERFAQREAEKRAAMTDKERARYNYLQRYGEEPYQPHDLSHLDVSVRLGTITQAAADAERKRHDEWKARHESREVADAFGRQFEAARLAQARDDVRIEDIDQPDINIPEDPDEEFVDDDAPAPAPDWYRDDEDKK